MSSLVVVYFQDAHLTLHFESHEICLPLTPASKHLIVISSTDTNEPLAELALLQVPGNHFIQPVILANGISCSMKIREDIGVITEISGRYCPIKVQLKVASEDS